MGLNTTALTRRAVLSHEPALTLLLTTEPPWPATQVSKTSSTRHVPHAPDTPRTTTPIGAICALAVDKAAFVAMLDEVHETLTMPKNDDNSSSAGLGITTSWLAGWLSASTTGNNSAATVTKGMLRSFPIKAGHSW